MRIVIVGGGEIGLGVARRLAANHAVVIVDLDPLVAGRVAALDVRFLAGNGTSPDVLRQAGVHQAEVLVAATGMDEVNVLASLIANRLGSPQTICVISRDDLLTPLGERDLLREHFGIDRVIWPEAQLAEEIERIVAAPGAIDAESFEGGRVALLEYRVGPDSMLATAPVAGLELPRGVPAVAVRRGERFSIPHGQTRFATGDKVFLMGTSEAIAGIQRRITGRRTDRRERVTIVGGGDVGFRLAQRLEARGHHDVRIIERDVARGERLAAALESTLVLNGDGTDLELLEAEDIGRSDVLVSVIDNDERNLLASLLARQLGVGRVISRVGRYANLRLFERIGVDVALSARGAAIAAIVHQVQGGQSRLLAVLEEGQAQVIEVQAPPSLPPTSLRSLRALPESIIGAILRGDRTIVPGGDDIIQAGDRLLVFTTTADAEGVRQYFAGAT